ncbi:MAG: ribbon-helix-helix protein, CopG family [Nanoarchaeota archaeon]|nr:ribbon-helix-helix protein, CopG family [DPANN group archaeon]MBL7116769.1 ribbon-helix-helix protein, CopG family [Nanoarchaeota archaeon]
MVTEMITVKLERTFLNEVDNIVKKSGYQNRTEFIRNALREKVEDAKLKEAMISIAHLKGAAKKKTTEEEYERIREQVFDEFDKKLK